MNRTLLMVNKLEKFIEKHGEDPFISQSKSKMLDYKIAHYEAEMKRLDKELKTFERTYGMKSTVFFKKFSEGKLGDTMDFIEWSSLYQMYNRLLEKKVIDSEPMNLKKVLVQIAKVLPLTKPE